MSVRPIKKRNVGNDQGFSEKSAQDKSFSEVSKDEVTYGDEKVCLYGETILPTDTLGFTESFLLDRIPPYLGMPRMMMLQ